MLKQAIAFAACALLCSTATAQIGPDVTTVKVGIDGSDQHDFHYYGQSGGIRAYSGATTSCNEGDQLAVWVPSPNPGHPVIAQNLYRWDGTSFKQIGMSWLKHSFCAVSEPGCGSCQPTGCSTLGLGCADTYWATLNGNQGDAGPRHEINAVIGTNGGTHASPTGNNTIRGRLQVLDGDVLPAQNPGARYAWEGHYVTADDHQAGNAFNNASWREADFSNPGNVLGVGNTRWRDAGIFAWQEWDANVTIVKADVIDEGGPGVHGRFWIGFSATDNGDGTWHYEYAVFNMCSDRSCGSLTIPVGTGVTVTNVEHHYPFYHSGEPYNQTDWTFTEGAGDINWSTTDWGLDLNANAIRWSTMYTFSFDANAGPTNGQLTVGLFKPGSEPDPTVTVRVPGNAPEPGVASCFGVGCPCANDDPSAGCANSTGSGALLAGSGSTSVTADNLVLTATGIPNNQQGLFYMGDAVVSNPLYDGFQCALGNTFRFLSSIQSSGATGTMSYTGFAADAPAQIVSGTTWNFHCWHRDVPGTPCGTGANFSNLYSVTFTP